MTKAFQSITNSEMWIYVSDEVYPEVSKNVWSVEWGGSTYYASRQTTILGIRKHIKLHNQLMNPPKGMFVDHRDRNGINDTFENMRYASHRDNCRNRGIRKDNISGYRGVSWNEQMGKWQASIYDRKMYYLGWYDDPVEAAIAYDVAAKERFGEFAYLNFDENKYVLDLSTVEYIYPKPLGLRGLNVPVGTIPLNDGTEMYVDEEDWERSVQAKWQATYVGDKVYATSHRGYTKAFLHREIMEYHLGRKLLTQEIVDHLDGNTRNIHKYNLLVRDNSHNRMTQRQRSDNTTGYRGVFLNKKTGKYDTGFTFRGNTYREFGFNTREDAGFAYDLLAIKYGDGYTILNFPDKHNS